MGIVDLSRFKNQHRKLEAGDMLRALSMETVHSTDDPCKFTKGTWTTPDYDCFLLMVLGQCQVGQVPTEEILGQAATVQLNRLGWLAAEDFGVVLQYVSELQQALAAANLDIPEPPDCLQGSDIAAKAVVNSLEANKEETGGVV